MKKNKYEKCLYARAADLNIHDERETEIVGVRLKTSLQVYLRQQLAKIKSAHTRCVAQVKATVCGCYESGWPPFSCSTCALSLILIRILFFFISPTRVKAPTQILMRSAQRNLHPDA